MDPVAQDAYIDTLLERITLSDTVEQARGYAHQIVQIRAQIRSEIVEAVHFYTAEEPAP